MISRKAANSHATEHVAFIYCSCCLMLGMGGLKLTNVWRWLHISWGIL